MCYRFVEKWLPRVLRENGWDCPDAIELSVWWRAISKCHIPIEAIGTGILPLPSILGRVQHIRHYAVHRLPDLPIVGIQDMVADALDLATVFRDASFIPKLNLWKEKLRYLLGVIKDASGSLDTVRKLDAINALKEGNISGQEKLWREISALEEEIIAKKQQVKTLHDEYKGHCDYEARILDGTYGELDVREHGKISKSHGTLKWLEECFSLNLDRDAPNFRIEESISGRFIKLNEIGLIRMPSAGINAVAAANLNSGGNRNNANTNILVGHRNDLINPDFIARENPGPFAGTPELGRRVFSNPITRSSGRQSIPANAEIVDLTADDGDVMVE